MIAALIGADGAELFAREVEAGAAVADVGLDVADGVGEAQGLIRRSLQNMEREPLGGAAADARQARELGEQAINGCGIGAVAGRRGERRCLSVGG